MTHPHPHPQVKGYVYVGTRIRGRDEVPVWRLARPGMGKPLMYERVERDGGVVEMVKFVKPVNMKYKERRLAIERGDVDGVIYGRRGRPGKGETGIGGTLAGVEKVRKPGGRVAGYARLVAPVGATATEPAPAPAPAKPETAGGAALAAIVERVVEAVHAVPVVAPEPIPEPEPAPAPAPVAVPIPAPEPEIEPTPEPELEPAPVAPPAPEPAPALDTNPLSIKNLVSRLF